MKCLRCQAENDYRLKFCEDCGAPLTRACPSCGAQVRADKNFCGECGSSLNASPTPRFTSPQQYTPKNLAERILLSKEALEGERKQVSVLFADIKGSMELLADRDPEEARTVLNPAPWDKVMGTGTAPRRNVRARSMGDGIHGAVWSPTFTRGSCSARLPCGALDANARQPLCR